VRRIRKFVGVWQRSDWPCDDRSRASEVSNGAVWNPDPSFNVADTILADPEFSSVLKTVLRDDHVLVAVPKAKGK